MRKAHVRACGEQQMQEPDVKGAANHLDYESARRRRSETKESAWSPPEARHGECTMRTKAARPARLFASAQILPTLGCPAAADVFTMPAGQTSLGFVAVGDPGNPPDRNLGGVAYTYRIGTFEVTAAQYTEFLNAVAKTDPFGLYSSPWMTSTTTRYAGCMIERSGTSGNYSYSVAANRANRPVSWVSWGDAVRFANWLTNGQPTGPQGPATTEDGSYYLNGATSDAALMAVTRRPDARYVIPTENEWYKAAYYDPNKPGGPGYWTYTTKRDWPPPSNVLSASGTNNANFFGGRSDSDYTIGGPYWRTEVGAFASCPGPYGAYDQGGNV